MRCYIVVAFSLYPLNYWPLTLLQFTYSTFEVALHGKCVLLNCVKPGYLKPDLCFCDYVEYNKCHLFPFILRSIHTIVLWRLYWQNKADQSDQREVLNLSSSDRSSLAAITIHTTSYTVLSSWTISYVVLQDRFGGYQKGWIPDIHIQPARLMGRKSSSTAPTTKAVRLWAPSPGGWQPPQSLPPVWPVHSREAEPATRADGLTPYATGNSEHVVTEWACGVSV